MTPCDRLQRLHPDGGRRPVVTGCAGNGHDARSAAATPKQRRSATRCRRRPIRSPPAAAPTRDCACAATVRLGKGDGGGAGAGGQPADLTDATWDFGASDGEIFTVIRDGTSADMESYAEQISETEIWNLVNYIRSIREP